MKLLYITMRFPYPPFKGDQAVAFNRLKYLSRKHEITLVSLYETEDELQGCLQLKNFCKEIYTVKLSKWQSIFNIIRMGLFSGKPFQVLYYQSDTLARQVQALLQNQHFDLVHSYLLRSAPYIQSIKIPKVLDLIDSMQLNFERRVAAEKGLKKWLVREELKRISTAERAIGESADRMIVVAETDKAYLAHERVSVIPLGVDTETFYPDRVLRQPHTIVFSGNMNYFPNDQAVRWFIDKCFSHIERAVPNVQLIIAGRNPSEVVKKYNEQHNIVITGFVESMPRLLNQAQIAIAPMQSGSGMQFKILEAMACGLPVVTTTLGLGDIKAIREKEIFVADSAENFAGIIIELLNNSLLTKDVGFNAHSYVLNNHSWECMADKVDDIYMSLIDDHKKGEAI